LNSKYLNGNPIEWLLEESDPSIRFLTRKEILEEGGMDSYTRVVESSEIKRLVNRSGNLLGDKKNFDLFYRGVMWCFAEAVERGLDSRTPLVRESAEFILASSQTPSGGFSLNWNPRTEIACRSGDMVKYMVRAGLDDDRMEKGIAWIAGAQRHDGGWLHCPLAGTCDQIRLIMLKKPGSGLNRETDPEVTSCFYATIACSMALVEFAGRTGTERYTEHIAKAAEFFLKRFLYKNSCGEPIRPRGGWNPDFRLIGYPVMSQYDILYGLLFIAKAGRISDRRTGEAFNLIMSKQNDDGTWNMESAGTGMLYGNDPKGRIGKKSKWVTLQAMRLLKLAGTY
jgi:hypothetical protein